MEKQITIVNRQVATVPLIRRTRSKLERLCLHHQLKPSQRDDLLLAFSEHASNFTKHNHREIWLSVHFQPVTKTLIIDDSGPSIGEKLAASPDLDSFTDNHQLYESGMGLVTIKALFPDYVYQQTEIGDNRLLLPVCSALPIIMIVDDDPVFLTVTEHYLSDQYQVIAFTDAHGALARLGQGDVDMVICDVTMPGIDGFELRRRMLETPAFASVPFIFMSGSANDGVQVKATGLEIDDFLQKPVSKGSLLTTLARVLTRSARLQSQIAVKLDAEVTSGLWARGPWHVGNIQGTLDYSVCERGGGDFLLRIPIENGQRFILGDVMGHGTQAKFFAYSVCGFITGLCASLPVNTPVNQFVSQLSTLICESELLTSTFVTLLVMDVFTDHRIDMVSAGHPPPFLFRSGKWSPVDIEGALPGMVADMAYQHVSLTLGVGDVLLAYTDGLMESVFNLESYEQAIKHFLAPLTLDPKTDIAAQCCSAWQIKSNPADDDVTLFSLAMSI